MGTQEEQEVGATPTRGWYRYRTGREPDGALAPASRSSPSELGSILSASDDDSRPVTKREVELLQVRIKGMFSNLRAALNDEVQRRDTVDTLVAGQIETLQSQLARTELATNRTKHATSVSAGCSRELSGSGRAPR